MTSADHGTTDPLAAIGDTLVAAARRRQASRRRRWRTLGATATALGAFAIAGAAFAVTGTPTGVPALDRWLDVVAERSPSMAPESHRGGIPVPPIPDIAPDDAMSPPVDVPMGGGVDWVGVGYATRDRNICGALVDPATADDPRGGAGCLAERLLRRALASQPARLTGAGGGGPTSDRAPTIVYNGVTRSDVTGLTVTPTGEPTVEAVLTEPWRPRGWGGRSLRVFFAVVPLRGQAQLRRGGLMPKLDARLADGRTVVVKPL